MSAPPVLAKQSDDLSRGEDNDRGQTHAPSHQEPPATPGNATVTTLTSSRFRFLGDTRAPPELHRLEVYSHRRRAEFKAHIYDLECRIASWYARLAAEVSEREALSLALTDRAVTRPLEAATEQILHKLEAELVGPILLRRACTTSGEEEYEIESTPTTLPALEGVVSRLDSAMLHHAHVAVYNAKAECLEPLDGTLRDDTRQTLRLEATKTDKREGGMVRKFESIAGTIEREVTEEKAARIAGLKLVEKGVAEAVLNDKKRAKEFLAEIREIREILNREREERQRQDQLILERIVRTREVLQRTVLESLGGAR